MSCQHADSDWECALLRCQLACSCVLSVLLMRPQQELSFPWPSHSPDVQGFKGTMCHCLIYGACERVRWRASAGPHLPGIPRSKEEKSTALSISINSHPKLDFDGHSPSDNWTVGWLNAICCNFFHSRLSSSVYCWRTAVGYLDLICIVSSS